MTNLARIAVGIIRPMCIYWPLLSPGMNETLTDTKRSDVNVGR